MFEWLTQSRQVQNRFTKIPTESYLCTMLKYGIKYMHWIWISGLIIFLIMPSFSVKGQDSVSIDSLLFKIETAKDDSTRIAGYLSLFSYYHERREWSKARDAALLAINYAKKKEMSPDAEVLMSYARALYHMGSYADAIKQMDQLMDLLKETNEQQKLAEARNFMGQIYYHMGEFQKSITILKSNIEESKQLKLAHILPVSYQYLSSVFRRLAETEEERQVLNRMADVSLKENNLEKAGIAYARLGDIGVTRDSNFVYAIKNYNKCLKYLRIEKDSTAIASALLRLAWAQYLNEDLETSLDNFERSLNYSIPKNNLTSITNAYGNIGTIYRDKKDYPKAIANYKKSIDYSLKASDWYNLSWLYKDMSQMYVQLNDYKLAYHNLLLHKQFSDSLERRNYSTNMAEARTRYETEKSKAQLELVSLKLRQQKFINYGFAGLIILGILIVLLLFRQTKLAAKRRISEMKHKVSEMTQINLRQQMNPHFIFNTLNSIQYYMYQHDKISTNNYLTMFASLMRTTLENSQRTSIPIQDELNALKLYLDLESIRFKEKFSYAIDVDDEIDPLLMKIPTMIIQPYVENALVHGLMNKEGEGQITISLMLKKKYIECVVEDNGIGRNSARKLKQNSSTHDSLGTKITESRLKLINALNGHQMKIQFTDKVDDSGKPSGTKVAIAIPIII